MVKTASITKWEEQIFEPITGIRKGWKGGGVLEH
jgi:hypothetical protein